jgi:hypothetical protein
MWKLFVPMSSAAMVRSSASFATWRAYLPTNRPPVRSTKSNATTFCNASTLALGAATPDAMVDVFGERVFEAVIHHGARGANCASPVDAGAVNGEENSGREVAAIALSHPSSCTNVVIHRVSENRIAR